MGGHLVWMERLFLHIANVSARLAGRPWTFFLCVAVVLAWALTGPMFEFSATWQLVINTGTTIVTFLMVFLIQNTQNRDGAAIQAKLDELLHAVRNADERFTGIERLSDKELYALLEKVQERAILIKGDGPPQVTTPAQERRLAAEAATGRRSAGGGSKDGRKAPVRRRRGADA
jgi:low affinity Fe/Cu permease